MSDDPVYLGYHPLVAIRIIRWSCGNAKQKSHPLSLRFLLQLNEKELPNGDYRTHQSRDYLTTSDLKSSSQYLANTIILPPYLHYATFHSHGRVQRSR